jgi:hypothetical protein
VASDSVREIQPTKHVLTAVRSTLQFPHVMHSYYALVAVPKTATTDKIRQAHKRESLFIRCFRSCPSADSVNSITTKSNAAEQERKARPTTESKVTSHLLSAKCMSSMSHGIYFGDD